MKKDCPAHLDQTDSHVLMEEILKDLSVNANVNVLMVIRDQIVTLHLFSQHVL